MESSGTLVLLWPLKRRGVNMSKGMNKGTKFAAATIGATTALISASTFGLNSANAATKVTAKKVTVKNGTFLGSIANTQFGPFQVSVTIKAGKIAKVSVPMYPNTNPRDVYINSQALPMLVNEVMQAQSSNINGIGGASYTSQAFYDSLTSALAKSGHK